MEWGDGWERGADQAVVYSTCHPVASFDQIYFLFGGPGAFSSPKRQRSGIRPHRSHFPIPRPEQRWPSIQAV